MYLKEMFNGEIISYFKKKIEKIVSLQVKDLIQIIVKFMTEDIFAHFSIIHKTPSRGAWHIVHQIFYK